MSLNHTLRSLRRSPGATALAILSLGLGIGLSTGAMALIEAFHSTTVPVTNSPELVALYLAGERGQPLPDAVDELAGVRALPGVTAAFAVASQNSTIEVNGRSQSMGVGRYEPGLFEMLGTAPQLGRFPDEQERVTEGAVVASNSFWHTYFPERADLTNAFVVVDDRVLPVVGVLPPSLESGVSMNRGLWLPLPSAGALATLRPWIIARLPSPAAHASLQNNVTNLAASYRSGTGATLRFSLQPFVTADFGTLDDFDYSLLVAAAAVLLVACINVMVLSLARGLARRRDYALRRALGASPTSLAGEVMAEVALLAVGGALAGALIAYWYIHLLVRTFPADLFVQGIQIPHMSARIFGAAAVSVLSALVLSGAAPAWLASRVAPSGALQENSGTTTGRPERRFRALIVVEFAAAMLLMFGSALTARSAQRMAREDFGYDVQHLQTASIRLRASDASPTAQRMAIIADALARVRAVDGVAAASVFVQETGETTPVLSDAARDPMLLPGYFRTGAGFFATAGIAVTSGRDFDDGDAASGTSAILSESAAEKLFGSARSAVGRSIRMNALGSDTWRTVVGIVRDVPLTAPHDPDTPAPPLAYLSGLDTATRSWSIAIKPIGNPAQVRLAVTRVLASALPTGANFGVEAWGNFEKMDRLYGFIRNIFGALGLAALLLGAVGIFSVFSFVVGQRRREFGVRVALGSSPRGVLALVFRGAAELTMAGIALGLLLSIWSGQILAAAVQGLHAKNQPVFIATTLVATAGLVLLVTAVSVLFPALRASRIDPVEVLRSA